MRIGVAVLLAVVMLLLGGIWSFRRTDAGAAADVALVPETGALLSPVRGGSVGSTIASLQARLRVAPTDARTRASLGLAYVQQARITGDPTLYPKAEVLLGDAVSSVPDGDASAEIGLAALAAARHDFAASLRHARRAAAISPYDGAVYGVMGDALLELGRYPAAFRAFQRFVDIEPGLAAYARVSYARELQGDLAGARRALQTATGVAGSPEDAAFAWFQLGELDWNRGDIASAADAYRTAEGFAPTWVPPEAGLARVAWARGDLDVAIARATDVATRLPLVEHVVLLGDLLTVAGDRRGAQAQYDVARAEAALLHANGVDVDLELALFEADHGDPRAALRAARAEWARRRSVHVADAYAWALHAVGRDAAATRLADLAVRLGTRSALFRYHAGMIAFAAGRRADGRAHLRVALDLNPSFSVLGAAEARAALRRGAA
jgi:tetratricopeptide (TPR) repeat protein